MQVNGGHRGMYYEVVMISYMAMDGALCVLLIFRSLL